MCQVRMVLHTDIGESNQSLMVSPGAMTSTLPMAAVSDHLATEGSRACLGADWMPDVHQEPVSRANHNLKESVDSLQPMRSMIGW